MTNLEKDILEPAVDSQESAHTHDEHLRGVFLTEEVRRKFGGKTVEQLHDEAFGEERDGVRFVPGIE
jgi:hypothetical protein